MFPLAFAFGQVADFDIQHIAGEKGLPLGFVRDIVQDKEGFLWISGKDVFYRYDGYEFLEFKNLQKGNNSWTVYGDTDLQMDEDGKLWIKDFYNVYKFNAEALQLENVIPVHSILKENNAIDINNHDFKIALDGSIYVTSAISSAADNSWRAWIAHFSSKGVLVFFKMLEFPVLVNPTLFLRSDTAWVVGPELIYGFTNKGYRLPPIKIPTDKKYLKFFDFYEDDTETIWLKADSREGNPVDVEDGLFYLKRGSREVKKVPLPAKLNLEKTNVFLKDKEGFWFGGLNHKLVYYNRSSGKWSELDENSSKFSNIPFRLSEAQDLIQTQNGVLWYTTSKGLIKIVKEDLPIESYLTTVDPNCLYEYCSMRGITEDEEGSIYFSYYSNLSKLSQAPKTLKPVLPEGACSPPGVYSLNWYNGFLYLNDLKINPKTGAYISILENNEIEKLNGHVTNLVDDKGKIWMFSWGPAGFYRYHPASDSLEEIALPTEFMQYAFEINDLVQGAYTKRIYLASARLGILVLDENGKFLSHYRIQDKDTFSLPSNNIKVVFEDADSSIWIGHPTGLSRIDLKKKTVQEFSIRNSSNYEVVGIIPEGDDKLWVSTNLGLFLFDKKSGEFQGFPLHTTLAQLEFNRASFFKSSSGRCYFGTLNGVFGFNPKEMLDYLNNREVNKVRLTSLSIFDDRQNGFKIRKSHLPDLNEIELTYHDRFFTLDISIPDFKSPTKIYYTYKLEGYDEAWSPLTTVPEVRYNRLPPGDYLLRIRGGSSERNFEGSERMLAVKVHLPWFKSWWFIMLMVLLVTLIVQLIFRIRLTQKLRVERMRTRLSSDLHDDVGSLLSGIAMQSEIMEMTATEDEKPKLQRLTDMSRSAMSRMRDIVWAMDARKDSMENLIDRIRDFGMEMLGARDISFKVENTIPANKKLSPPVRQHLYLICKEAITNVWKHSDGDSMEIFFFQKGNGLILSIEDNGTASSENFKNSGLGLSNMKMRAEAMGGSISITTENGVHISVFVKNI
jgi:ligand-binding sensor domain-containing protein/two-component sensor histidine kinase